MKPNPVYSNSVLAARMHLLLDQNRIKRMVSANSFEDAAKVLLECGYDENTLYANKQNEDLIILSEHTATINIFKKLCSDNALLACLTAEYDYHNAKVLYTFKYTKTGKISDKISPENITQEATYPFGNINLTKLEKIIASKEYKFLPDKMSEAFQQLDSMQNPVPAEINRIFKQALFAEIKQNVEKIKSTEARKYFLNFLATGQHVTELKPPPSADDVFSLDIVWNWFIMKQAELRIVNAILTGKKLGLGREKIRELIRGINDN